MDQIRLPRQPEGTTTATLFTNNLGQVIFVDQAFLQLMGYPEAGVIAGEPLYKVLGLDQPIAQRLFEHVLKTGHVDNELVELRKPIGTALRMFCSGVATYDSGGSFRGADLTLHQAPASGKVQAQPSSRAETVDTAIPAEPLAPESNIFLQLYFTSQLKGLYVLLSRLVGVQVHKKLDKIINETARQSGWAVQVESGVLTDLANTNAEVYGVLLRKVVSYAVGIIGQRVVAREMEAIDGQMHEGVRVLAAQSGLRDIVKNSH
jgi:hypothetical protein